MDQQHTTLLTGFALGALVTYWLTRKHDSANGCPFSLVAASSSHASIQQSRKEDDSGEASTSSTWPRNPAVWWDGLTVKTATSIAEIEELAKASKVPIYRKQYFWFMAVDKLTQVTTILRTSW